jgi:hypothetical protein
VIESPPLSKRKLHGLSGQERQASAHLGVIECLRLAVRCQDASERTRALRSVYDFVCRLPLKFLVTLSCLFGEGGIE